MKNFICILSFFFASMATSAEYVAAGGKGIFQQQTGKTLDLKIEPPRSEGSDWHGNAYFSAGVTLMGDYRLRDRVPVRSNAGLYGMINGCEAQLCGGIGLVVLAHSTAANGSRLNAIINAGWYGERFRIYWLHISNADLKFPNYGYDAVLFGVKF